MVYCTVLYRSAVYGVATQEEGGAVVQMVTPELRSWIQAVIMEDEVKVDQGDYYYHYCGQQKQM